MQTVFIDTSNSTYQLDLPNKNQEILSGVRWGDVLAFPTLAFWAFKVIERRVKHTKISYKLGNSLLEETGACLLGGHGIPAEIGLAAFSHLKNSQIFNGEKYSEKQIFEVLSQPIALNDGRQVKYRFAKQKANYLFDAITKLVNENSLPDNGKDLRNWLLNIKGIGPKTASWIARNWLDADDVAILDIHIYRAGLLANFFSEHQTVEKHYFDLEKRFLEIAEGLDVRASELDAVIWFEMQRSKSVHNLLKHRKQEVLKKTPTLSFPFSYQTHSNPYKISVI